MFISKDSHLDHGLTAAHVAWILQQFGDVSVFVDGPTPAVAIHTVDLPGDLPAVPCALRGPIVGDAPIVDAEVCYVKRGQRSGESRMTSRYGAKPSRKLTVIIGAHEGHTILFTAYGGPVAPREPFDPSLDDAGREASRAFWADHALAIE